MVNVSTNDAGFPTPVSARMSKGPAENPTPSKTTLRAPGPDGPRNADVETAAPWGREDSAASRGRGRINGSVHENDPGEGVDTTLEFQSHDSGDGDEDVVIDGIGFTRRDAIDLENGVGAIGVELSEAASAEGHDEPERSDDGIQSHDSNLALTRKEWRMQ